MADWLSVARIEELLPGQRRIIDIDAVRVLVINVDGVYYAVEDLCTHDGGELGAGNIEGDEIVCPRHQAHFSLKTGDAVSGPAYDPIATFPVRLEDGWIQVRDQPSDS